MRDEKQGDSRCGYSRDVYRNRPVLGVSMRLASAEMPDDEQVVRVTLASLRPPPGRVWTEGDVRRALADIRAGRL